MRFFGAIPWLIAGLLVTFPLITTADEQAGITVTPSLTKLDLSDTSPTTTLTYRNTTSETIELSLKAEDFTALEDGWKVKFLDQKNESNYRYGLSSWIKFETDSVTLHPGEEQSVKIFIDATRLSPGGHYASLLAEIKQANGQGNVSLRGILASLLFVRTATGQEIEDGVIKSVTTNQHIFSFPTLYTILFQNKGTVDLTPYGLVEVNDFHGHTVAKGILNQDSAITLPESIRKYDVPVIPQKNFLLPGVYQAHIKIHYGKTNKEIVIIQQFLSIGSMKVSYLVGSTIILLGGITIFFFWFKKTKTKEHNN